jgi:hypothetical protein
LWASLEFVAAERFWSESSSAVRAVFVRAQECACTALETASKALEIVRLSSAESSPLPLPLDPQATRNAAAKPSMAASSARVSRRRDRAGTAG